MSSVTFLIFTTVGYGPWTLPTRHTSASDRIVAGTTVTISARVDSAPAASDLSQLAGSLTCPVSTT